MHKNAQECNPLSMAVRTQQNKLIRTQKNLWTVAHERIKYTFSRWADGLALGTLICRILIPWALSVSFVGCLFDGWSNRWNNFTLPIATATDRSALLGLLRSSTYTSDICASKLIQLLFSETKPRIFLPF